MLFADERRHSLTLPAAGKDGQPANIADLIEYLCQKVMKDTRQELFVLDAHLYVSQIPWSHKKKNTIPFAARAPASTPLPCSSNAASNGGRAARRIPHLLQQLTGALGRQQLAMGG